MDEPLALEQEAAAVGQRPATRRARGSLQLATLLDQIPGSPGEVARVLARAPGPVLLLDRFELGLASDAADVEEAASDLRGRSGQDGLRAPSAGWSERDTHYCTPPTPESYPNA